MSIYALQGSDTIIIKNRTFTAFANQGDICTIAFAEDSTKVYASKNGNAAFVNNAAGQLVNVELHILVGSDDDKFLNSEYLAAFQNPGYILLNGTFVKNVGDGQGNISYIKFALTAGKIMKNIDAKENVSGENEQVIAMYKFTFANGIRTIS